MINYKIKSYLVNIDSKFSVSILASDKLSTFVEIRNKSMNSTSKIKAK